MRKITVVVPCFNEVATVREVIRRVGALDVDKQIVVIDNCSTDGTRELLLSLCSGAAATERDSAGKAMAALMPGQQILSGDGFVLVLQPKNRRKGNSVRTGLALADSEYVVCQDADLEYDPQDILRLLAHAERTKSVAVFGSRLATGAVIGTDMYQLGRVMLARLFSVLYGCRVSDVATCYKLMRTDVARSLQLRCSGFDLDFEIAAKLRRREHVIDELPIAYRARDHAAGKKIRWRDGVFAVWTLLWNRVAFQQQ